MLGLGGSVGTPKAGHHGAGAGGGLARRAHAAERRRRRARSCCSTCRSPTTSRRRQGSHRRPVGRGAGRARVACLIRSVASHSIRSPHTGITRYDSTAAKIPAAALSVEDATMLHRFQDRGEPVVVTLTMGARTLPDAPSRNVVAEIVGREKPDEVVVLGGHIDSWDVGQGAMDDGGGAVGGVGGGAADPAARPPAAAHGAGGALDQRGERRQRRHWPTATRTRPSWASTCWRSSRTTACSSPKGFVLAAPTRRPRWCSRWPACSQPINATGVQRVAGEPGGRHHAAGGAGRARRWSSTWTASATSGITTARATRSTSWIRRELARCVAAMAVMAYVVADLPEPLPHATN